MCVMKNVRAWTPLFIVLALSACQLGPGKEITSTKPYADLIGEKYSVVADDLYAYGVYESLDDRIVTYITLVPRGASGREYAFRRHIPKGWLLQF